MRRSIIWFLVDQYMNIAPACHSGESYIELTMGEDWVSQINANCDRIIEHGTWHLALGTLYISLLSIDIVESRNNTASLHKLCFSSLINFAFQLSNSVERVFQNSLLDYQLCLN